MIVIHNPAAGMARGQMLANVLRHLERAGVDVELVATARAGHAEEIARAAAGRGGSPVVVAAGGDGTIAEVVNGLEDGAARLGIIPIGTANVLAHELGLPTQPAAIAAMLAAGHCRPLWTGVIARPGRPPRRFVQMLSVGFDAHVVRTLPAGLKRWLGRAAYAVQALRSLPGYGFPRIALDIDGLATEAHGVIVSKGRYYGGAYPLAPDARVTGPDFTVTLLDRPGALPMLRATLALGRGRLPGLSGIRQLRAADVAIRMPAGVPADMALQADGDWVGTTPCRVGNAARPLRVVVPAD